MGSRERPVDIGALRGHALLDTLLRELRAARLDRNLSGAAIADAAGLSRAQYSRIERGLIKGVTLPQLGALLAAVGLDLSARAFPGGPPIRDAAHAALLGRLRSEVHPSLRTMTEVPFPLAGDRRAWDIVVIGNPWRHAFEAETRPRDLQALERRIALKLRDGEVDAVSLLLLDSRDNRRFVREHAASLREHFPVHGSRAMELLRVGADPGRGSVVLL